MFVNQLESTYFFIKNSKPQMIFVPTISSHPTSNQVSMTVTLPFNVYLSCDKVVKLISNSPENWNQIYCAFKLMIISLLTCFQNNNNPLLIFPTAINCFSNRLWNFNLPVSFLSFIPGWYEDNWYEANLQSENISCSKEEMRKAAEGHLTTEALMWNQNNQKTISGMSSEDFRLVSSVAFLSISLSDLVYSVIIFYFAKIPCRVVF